MSIDHRTFEEAIDELDDLDALPAELAEHAATCSRCSTRLELAHRIRTTAHLLAPDIGDTDNITESVLATTHPRRPSRTMLVGAVAAAAIVAVGAGVFVANRSATETDVLAEIADDYRTSDGTRFVYATEATIDIADVYDLDTDTDDVQPLARSLPTCTETQPTTEASRTLDLGPIAEALATNDPCLALELIDDTLAQPAIDTYQALAASINQATDEVATIDAAEPGSPLAAAAGAAYREQRQDEIAAAEVALEELVASFTSLSTTLEPLAEQPEIQPGSVPLVEDRVLALKSHTVTAAAVTIDSDTTVTWTQIATGTWTATGIEIEGTTEHNNQADTFTDVNGDPLGLTVTVFAAPDTLTAILDSAPPSTNNTIEWTVPDELIAGPETWTATAHVAGRQLLELTLTSAHATITLTPGR